MTMATEPDPHTPATRYSSFFNHLVDLIPAKFYRSHDGDTHLNLQHMNKADRAAAQQGFKAKQKVNKRAKLAELPTGGGEAADDAGPDGDATTAPPSSSKDAAQHAPLLNIPTENLSRTELQEKLQKRLQDMQQQRKHVGKIEAAKKAKDWKQKTLEQNAKAKQQQQQQQDKRPAQSQQQKQAQQNPKQKGQKRPAEGEAAGAAQPKKQAAEEGSSGLAFPRIEVDEGRLGDGRGKGPKKPSKEVLLKIAEAKQKERQEGAKTEEGKPKLAQEAWKSALARASGEKVLDDPKLLRKSLKKDAKKKEKSAKGWQERVHAQEEEAATRQNKRKDNLQSRMQGRVDKKKASREKKLLRAGDGGKAPRAGFEGRRTDFIGGGAKAAAKKP